MENVCDIGAGLLPFLKVEAHGLQESIHTVTQCLMASQCTDIYNEQKNKLLGKLYSTYIPSCCVKLDLHIK